jgi:hypothetical protein
MTDQEQKKNSPEPDFKEGGISGLINRLFAKPGKIAKVIFLLIFFTWLPMLILSLVSGEFKNSGPSISFLEDFYVHVRFLIALPFMIVLEKVINPSFQHFIDQTKERISTDQLPKFNKLIGRISKLLASHIPEIAFLILFFYFTYTGWDDLPVFNTDRSYLTSSDSELAPAGWYYLLISTPIFSLLFFRWLWRWVIWAYSMYKFSKLSLELDPMHADQMAGMYYLNSIAFAFSFVIIIPSVLLSALAGMDILYSNAVITQFAFQIGVYVILLPIIAYLPLLFFTPQMIKAKAFGLSQFGDLIRAHNTAYKSKWLSGSLPSDEPILGSADHSSLADINGSYGPVFGTKAVPLNLKLVLATILLTLMPYVPLVFTYYSVTQVLKSLISTMFGS